MKPVRRVWRLAWADVSERVRTYGYLLTLIVAAYLGWTAHEGYWEVRLGRYFGSPSASWIGLLMALVGAVTLSLVGFYLVAGSVERDRRSGVGEILAATTVSDGEYVLAKYLSHLTVLGSMLAVVCAAALVVTAADPEIPVSVGDTLMPLVLVTLPTCSVTAGLAVFFSCVPWLRGGGGNVAYFFLWSFLLGLPAIVGAAVLDPIGYQASFESLAAALKQVHPGADPPGMTVAVSAGSVEPAGTFAWHGFDVTREMLLGRLSTFAAGPLVALAGLAGFRRFDPSREGGRESGKGRFDPTAWLERQETPGSRAAGASGPPGSLPRLAGSDFDFGRLRLLAAEIRILLQGQPWWWYVVAVVLSGAMLFVPLGAARTHLLPLVWIWPVLIWSPLGNRARTHGTAKVVFSIPSPLRRQLATEWAAGIVVALAFAAAPLVRFALAGEALAAAELLAGALFVPSLALGLGVWTGGPRTFEAVYTVLWYVGPLNGLPLADFAGAAGDAEPIRVAGQAALALVLFAGAWVGRRRKLATE